MLDAKGVFFNARPEPQENSAGPVVAIQGINRQGVDEPTQDLQALSALFDSANIKFLPPAEVLKSGAPRSAEPVMLHNPKSKAWPVRDQGTSRGTCVSFAALALLELHELRKSRQLPRDEWPDDIDYSEEFVYAKSRSDHADLGPVKDPCDDPSGATFLVQAARTLTFSGVLPEKSLPYRYIKNDPDWTAKVSSELSEQAATAKLSEDAIFVTLKDPPRPNVGNALTAPFPEKDRVELIQLYLRNGSAVAITLPVYATANHTPWTVGNAWKAGVIPDPTQAVKAAGSGDIGHAVCIVGMLPDPESEGGGWFIFRNSWGTRFGYARPSNPALDAVLAPGYGAISFAHVGQECWGMMALLSSS